MTKSNIIYRSGRLEQTFGTKPSSSGSRKLPVSISDHTNSSSLKQTTMSKNKKSAAAAAAKINTQPVATAATTSIEPFQAISMNIPLSMIDPSPFNPRKTFVESDLLELAGSIRQHGVQTDIKVRPTADGRYQIVYGERRWRASQLAEKETIPAKIEQMTDEQAENCAIIENMQRENFTPFEEGEIFNRKAKEGKMKIDEICKLFDKSRGYVQTRMNLRRLIPEVVEMLNTKIISLEVAKEFSNYNKEIQKEVYTDHFTHDNYNSWKGIAAKDFAKKLYDRYMTKLDNYIFDKTECTSCAHNTMNQVLFTMCGDCAGCQRPSCLQKKNTAYLVQQCIDLVTNDPHIHIATDTNSDVKAVAQLTELGHEVLPLERGYWNYIAEKTTPEVPVKEDFPDEDEWRYSMEKYETKLASFEKEAQDITRQVAEGTMLKFAFIGATSIKIYYEIVKKEIVDKNGVTQTIKPEEPARKLKDKDERNHSICFEHITKDLKKVFRCDVKSFPKTEITLREEQMFFYVLLHQIHYHKEKLLGVKENGADSQKKYLKLAENLTPEKKTMIMRMAIMEHFNKLSENYCKPDSVDIKLMTEFADQHFAEQSKAVQERHKDKYEKQHKNLAVRIKNIENEAELLRLQALAASEKLEPLTDGALVDTQTGEVLPTTAVGGMLPAAAVPESPEQEPQVIDEPLMTPEPEQPEVEPEDIPQEPEPVYAPEPETPEIYVPEIKLWDATEDMPLIPEKLGEQPAAKGKRIRLTSKKTQKAA